jgi:hypothetical protein
MSLNNTSIHSHRNPSIRASSTDAQRFGSADIMMENNRRTVVDNPSEPQNISIGMMDVRKRVEMDRI